jgi:putative DNA primase/helicase
MTATEIAAALGGARRSGQWWRCVCPVHGSRTGRSLTRALRDGDRCGLIAVCHAGCSRADILTELRRRGLLEDAPHYGRCPAPAIDRTDDRDDPARRIALARRIWDGAQDALGTEVVQYLSGRTLDIEPPACLRWAPRCWHREARTELPAMLARVDGADGALVGVHRTYLWPTSAGNGSGATGPRSARSAAARLAEGIETTLAAMIATGLPGWAALSTSGMTALAPPPIARTVIIVADHDTSGAGERPACAAAARWLSEGRRVRIAMPPIPGTDMADVLAGRAYAAIGDVGDAAA